MYGRNTTGEISEAYATGIVSKTPHGTPCSTSPRRSIQREREKNGMKMSVIIATNEAMMVFLYPIWGTTIPAMPRPMIWPS
jgi:hypothetical protein